MIDRSKFNLIKKKYGYFASWAIWAEEGETPKSNIGDLSIFASYECLKELKSDTILVALNISRGSIKTPLANFHDSNPRATDFRIRFALKNTPLWGSYMTDIIKNYNELDSKKIPLYLKENPQIEEENISLFREELRDLGSINPTIIAFGVEAYKILYRNFEKEFRILKIPHYAVRIKKEKYRKQVQLLTNL